MKFSFIHIKTPLHFAVQSGSLKIINILISKGANKKIHDKSSKYPIDYSRSPEISKLLK
jgi:ankyrin repeat protein